MNIMSKENILCKKVFKYVASEPGKQEQNLAAATGSIASEQGLMTLPLSSLRALPVLEPCNSCSS